MIDITKSIIWQYNDNKPLIGVVENQQSFIDKDVTGFFNDFYNNIYNVETANLFGLLVWARILGLTVPAFVVTPSQWFGFNSNATNFNAGYYPSMRSLPVAQLRLLIKLRYIYLTTFANIDNITEQLSKILPGLNVLDTLKMEIIITYPTTFTSDVQYLLNNFFNEIIPIPATVGTQYRVNYPKWFCFTGADGVNFNNGNFGG